MSLLIQNGFYTLDIHLTEDFLGWLVQKRIHNRSATEKIISAPTNKWQLHLSARVADEEERYSDVRV